MFLLPSRNWHQKKTKLAYLSMRGYTLLPNTIQYQKIKHMQRSWPAFCDVKSRTWASCTWKRSTKLSVSVAWGVDTLQNSWLNHQIVGELTKKIAWFKLISPFSLRVATYLRKEHCIYVWLVLQAIFVNQAFPHHTSPHTFPHVSTKLLSRFFKADIHTKPRHLNTTPRAHTCLFRFASYLSRSDP